MKKAWLLLSLMLWSQSSAQSVPQARMTVSPGSGDLSTVFIIDASESLNALGNNRDLEYQFRQNQYSSRTPFTTNPRFSFRSERTGTLTAEVTVRDRRSGLTSVSAQRYTVRQTQQRAVQIRVSNPSPAPGESVTYEAVVFGNGINRDQLQSRWDFNSDGRFETNFRPGLVASFTPEPGRSFPTVEIRFPDGSVLAERGFELNTNVSDRNQNQISSFVTTPRRFLKPPVIEVTPRPQQIRENTNVTFDGSKTERLKNSYLEWVVESQTISGKEKINYVFKTGGQKTVTLRHCLMDQSEPCQEASVTVAVETPPNDQFLQLFWHNLSDQGRRNRAPDYALITATDNLRFTVRPQGNTQPQQRFLYRWDFEGDGVWDTDFQAETHVEHQYLQTGNFVLVVEALPSLTTRNFERLEAFLPVYVERNRAPFGDFELRQENNFVGEKVTYTAVATDSESGHQVEVRFDSDGDGVWDSDFRNQRSWWWVYDRPGEYNVRMQLRDPQGRLEEISKVMTIFPMPEPQTFVQVSHRNQVENQSILLDASDSVGRNLTYEWTVQGERLIKRYGVRTNLRLPAGEYQVQLTIRDRLGAQDSVVFPVTFSAEPSVINPGISTPTTQTASVFSPNSVSTLNTSNIINRLPGARMEKNFILPPEGAPSIVSPFQIDAGANPIDRPSTNSMRAVP